MKDFLVMVYDMESSSAIRYSLLREAVKDAEENKRVTVLCYYVPGEVAFINGWIDNAGLMKSAEKWEITHTAFISKRLPRVR